MLKKSLQFSQEDKRIDIKPNHNKGSLFGSKIANSKNSFARNDKIGNQVPAYQNDSNFLECLENDSRHSNMMDPDTRNYSSVPIVNKDIQGNNQKAVSFNSLKNAKSSLFQSLIQSSESINVNNNQSSSMLRSIRSSHPEQFLMRQTQSQKRCMNGDMKKAKYKIKNSNEYLCSRCAILLLQRGYAIEELKQFSSRGSRVQQNQNISKLLSRISTASNRIASNLKESQQEVIKNHLNSICQDEMMLYNSIIEAVQEMKRRSKIKYQGIFNKVQLEMKNEETQLLQKLQQIQVITNQINNTTDQQQQYYLPQWINELDNIEKYNRLQVQLKHQPIQQQLQSIIKNIYEYLDLSVLPKSPHLSMLNSMRSSKCRTEQSRNLFTNMLRQSQQRFQ